jgi:acetyltransferase-like isoleucine patch superfamily enzyme
VADNAVVAGNPARFIRWIDERKPVALEEV